MTLPPPPGTPSTLLFERPRDILSEKFDEWPFLTVHYWGEKAVGVWRLEVTNSGSRVAHQPGKAGLGDVDRVVGSDVVGVVWCVELVCGGL